MQSVAEISDAIAAANLTSRQAVENCFEAIDARDPTIRAFLSHDRQRALARADDIDRRRAAGEPLGPLGGVPVAVKDNLVTTWGATTCGSRILEGFCSPYDAAVVERLEGAGAVIVGKTNLDEFAMGSSCENSGFFPTRNPWDTDRVPGGSSGGSAAAVAAGMVPGALGSDTGGSIRLPGSFCGVTALKPTYGRVSRYGLVAYGSSLDQIGPFARSVRDAATLLGVIAGHDPRDSTSVDRPVPDYAAALDKPLGDLTIGRPTEAFGEGLDPRVGDAVTAALDDYARRGAEVVDVHLPHLKYSIACYYLVATAEASSNLARYDGVRYGHRTERPADFIDLYAASRAEGFGSEVKRRIMLGTYALSSGYYDAYYLKALKVRTLIRNDFLAAFERCDVLAMPVAPTPAFKLGEKTDDPLTMYLTDIYTNPANLAGIPGISVPCGLADGRLPIGLQLLAAPFAEPRLLQVAHAWQQATDWHTRTAAI